MTLNIMHIDSIYYMTFVQELQDILYYKLIKLSIYVLLGKNSTVKCQFAVT